jgi:hypothetical protein
MSDLPYIPSELLEPHFTCMIGEWFQMVKLGRLTMEQMTERLHAFDCLATALAPFMRAF